MKENPKERLKVIMTGNPIAEEAMRLLETTCIVECTPNPDCWVNPMI